jgi:hypothetical protein
MKVRSAVEENRKTLELPNRARRNAPIAASGRGIDPELARGNDRSVDKKQTIQKATGVSYPSFQIRASNRTIGRVSID